MSYPGISFRPITPEDEPFLYELYTSTRLDELATLNWGQSKQDVFLKMQFNAQQNHYQSYLPHANFDIVLLNTKPIGRLYLRKSEEEFHIVDIALLLLYREKGIGSALLESVLNEAAALRRPVRLHVVKTNPAISLYKRFGFYQTDDTGTHFKMEWSNDFLTR
jgi:ribosomal protein S18 acetylase RimI-like enzyme